MGRDFKTRPSVDGVNVALFGENALLSGSGAPAGGTGIVGNWYWNTLNGDVYEKTGASTWTLRGSVLGPSGEQGIPGTDGEDADNWPVPGPQGNIGPQGIQGAKGAPGTDGEDGESWPIPGPQGNIGPQGIQGVKGAPGTDGEDGDSWPIPGPQGNIGPQGVQGIQGIQGISGVPGIDGEDADSWPIPGPQGPQGSQGTSGSQGPQGVQGIQGLSGTPGIDGEDGDSWPVPGPQGNPGAPGTPGAQGIQGLSGTPGIDGEDGDSWPVPGPQGNPGAAGATGAQGPAGGGTLSMYYRTDTSDSDPGANSFKFNNATIASATFMYISTTGPGGADITAWIEAWDDPAASVLGYLIFSTAADPTKFNIFGITNNVVSATGYRKVPISHVAGSGITTTDNTLTGIGYTRSGQTGTTGQQGLFGGDALIFNYDATSTADGDPGAGKFRSNNGDPTIVTFIYVNTTDAGGADATAWLDALDDSNSSPRGRLKVMTQNQAQNYAIYNINGAIVTGSGYKKIPVTYISGGGWNSTNLRATLLTFTMSGDDGSSGAAGAAGARGMPGLDGEDGDTWPIPGPQGNIGPQGNAGSQGIQGFPGAQGMPGIDGEDADSWPIPGPRGIQGFTGPQGVPGVDGDDADSWPIPGSRGATGPKVAGEIFLSAAGMWPSSTGGCAAPVLTDSGSNDVNYYGLDFDGSTNETAEAAYTMPSDWDGGTVTATFYWAAVSDTGTGSVIWGCRGVCLGDGDALNTAYGTSVEVTDNNASTALQARVSAATAPITIANAGAGKYTQFKITRNAASDSINTDARLIGVKIAFTRT